MPKPTASSGTGVEWALGQAVEFSCGGRFNGSGPSSGGDTCREQMMIIFTQSHHLCTDSVEIPSLPMTASRQ